MCVDLRHKKPVLKKCLFYDYDRDGKKSQKVIDLYEIGGKLLSVERLYTLTIFVFP